MKNKKASKEMKKNSNRLSFKTAFFKGSYVHNSVLTTLTGICPIVAAATNIKNATMLSFAFTLVIIICEVVASAVMKKLSRWVRICFYTLLSGFVLVTLSMVSDQSVSAALGVFLPFLCVNGIIALRCEKFAVRTNVYNAFVDSVAAAVGFTAVAFLTGAIRGLFTSSLIFEGGLSAFSMPFVGFIVLGFLAAIHKWSVLTFFPNEISDTFSLSGAFEKPIFKDPGLMSKEQLKKDKEKKRQIKKEKEDFEQLRPRYSIEDLELDNETKEEQEDE